MSTRTIRTVLEDYRDRMTDSLATELSRDQRQTDGHNLRFVTEALAELEALERQAKTDARERAIKAHARLVQNQPSAALAVLESVLFSDAMPSDEKLDEIGAGDLARATATWNAAIEAAAQNCETMTAVWDDEACQSFAAMCRALKREAK